MEIGIVGLTFSGKSTLFATLTGLEMPSSHGPGKLEAHHGIVKVPDPRLDDLTRIFQPKKQVNATIEYLDVTGLESYDTRSKAFDSHFLQVLKNTDALCLVIQAFHDDVHPHPLGSIDPARDVSAVESEFLLSDLGIVENRLNRLEKQILQAKQDDDIRERDLMLRFKNTLEQEKPLREFPLSPEERLRIRGFQFLSAKPLLVVVNYDESDIPRENEVLVTLSGYQDKPGVKVTGISARVEMEISRLEEPDRTLFLQEMKIKQSARDKLIQQSYDLLGLISFFTFNENECRAWTIPRSTPAQAAAGTVHSDMERGFIRAEVVHYDDFMKWGSMARCREHGVLRLEGKDYIVQDGDLILVRFNV